MDEATDHLFKEDEKRARLLETRLMTVFELSCLPEYVTLTEAWCEELAIHYAVDVKASDALIHLLTSIRGKHQHGGIKSELAESCLETLGLLGDESADEGSQRQSERYELSQFPDDEAGPTQIEATQALNSYDRIKV